MREFLEFAKAFLLLAAICLWLWGAGGHAAVRQYHRKNPAPQNWQSCKRMFTDKGFPIHTEFRETVLGVGGFLLCGLLLCIIAQFDPA